MFLAGLVYYSLQRSRHRDLEPTWLQAVMEEGQGSRTRRVCRGCSTPRFAKRKRHKRLKKGLDSIQWGSFQNHKGKLEKGVRHAQRRKRVGRRLAGLWRDLPRYKNGALETTGPHRWTASVARESCDWGDSSACILSNAEKQLGGVCA